MMPGLGDDDRFSRVDLERSGPSRVNAIVSAPSMPAAPPRQPGAGAARHDRDVELAAEPDELGDLGGLGRQSARRSGQPGGEVRGLVAPVRLAIGSDRRAAQVWDALADRARGTGSRDDAESAIVLGESTGPRAAAVAGRSDASRRTDASGSMSTRAVSRDAASAIAALAAALLDHRAIAGRGAFACDRYDLRSREGDRPTTLRAVPARGESVSADASPPPTAIRAGHRQPHERQPQRHLLRRD